MSCCNRCSWHTPLGSGLTRVLCRFCVRCAGEFLSNDSNKADFLAVLMDVLEGKGVPCTQADGDADALIVSTAVGHACNAQLGDRPAAVTIVGEDTDLYVLALGSAQLTEDPDAVPLLVTPPACISRDGLVLGDNSKCMNVTDAQVRCAVAPARLFLCWTMGHWHQFLCRVPPRHGLHVETMLRPLNLR